MVATPRNGGCNYSNDPEQLFRGAHVDEIEPARFC